jgi:hypothetical protein
VKQSDGGIYERLHRLERENRYTRVALIVVIVVALGFTFFNNPRTTSAQVPVSQEIDTQKLVIKDAHGTDRIVLSVLAPDATDPNGPASLSIMGTPLPTVRGGFFVTTGASYSIWTIGYGQSTVYAVASASKTPQQPGESARISVTGPFGSTMNVGAGSLFSGAPGTPSCVAGSPIFQPPSISAYSGVGGHTWTVPGWPATPCPR